MAPGILYSNMPWLDAGGPCIGFNGVNKTGVAVMTPAGAPYQITSVLASMHDVGQPSDFDLRVYDDGGGIWGTEVGAFGIESGPGGGDISTYEFFPAAPIALAPSTVYWIVATVTNEADQCAVGWDSGGSAPAGIFTYVDALQYFDPLGLLQRNSRITLEINGELIERFDKEITAGNDYDGEDGIDLAVEVGIEAKSQYDFKINYNQPDFPPVQIEDTVPAEWQVMGLENDSLNCEIAGANKKDDGKSATKLVCLPDGTEGMVTVLADARCHDSKNNKKCRPTSCGALYLNNGAAAYELDPDTGEPVLDDEGNRLPPLLETNALCLVAVSDLDGGGIDYSGNGDEDGDGLLDREEACGVGSDPCVADTDGDGVNDFDEVASGCMDPLNPDTDGDTINDGDELAAGTDPCAADSDDDGYDDNQDACPLEGPADPDLGEILGEDGCIRQSQCSDGIDNDDDGPIDFPDDASCDDIMDDSEDTPDPVAEDCVEANGLLWCYNNSDCGEACNEVCASKGMTPVADSNAWFEAQNTTAECQAIADALGGGLVPVLNSWAFACLEDSPGEHTVGGGLRGPGLYCSTSAACPDRHRTLMDQQGIACGPGSRRSICPCE